MQPVKMKRPGQVKAFGTAEDNSIWRTLASVNFTVDAATKAQAQKDIGEDGYWGVKQTSQRLFDLWKYYITIIPRSDRKLKLHTP